MDYLQYQYELTITVRNKGFKPYYKWIIFNTKKEKEAEKDLEETMF